jgi:lauroyl/myristoyl acyltransferase
MPYRLICLLVVLLPKLPRWLALWGAAGLGLLGWLTARTARAAVRDNLAHVPGLAAQPGRLRRAVRGVFIHMALNYADLLRLPNTEPCQIQDTMTVWGLEHVNEALAAGKGLVMVTPHLGNFDYAIQWIIGHGYRVTIPVERIAPKELFELFLALRTSMGVVYVPADTTEGLRTMLRALARNEIVLIAADRLIYGRGVTVDLFGTPTMLPAGPALLARRSGAALLGVGCWRETWRQTFGIFSLLPDALPSLEQDAATAPQVPGAVVTTQRIARFLEQLISAHPEQWVVLSRIWPAP